MHLPEAFDCPTQINANNPRPKIGQQNAVYLSLSKYTKYRKGVLHIYVSVRLVLCV